MGQHTQITQDLAPNRGVTLMELLTVVALVGLVSSLAVGSFRKIQAKSQARASIEDLTVALHRARSDASTRQRLSGIAIATDTSNSFTSGGSPRKGLKYLRFVDSDVGTQGIFDATDTIIQNWTSLKGQVFAYTINSSGLSAGTVNLVFHTDGSLDNDLQMNLGIANFTDTFRLGLLPATGLATLDH
jgi:prepilin-type N-terminal cleavage/methylation domain-containing protein